MLKQLQRMWKWLWNWATSNSWKNLKFILEKIKTVMNGALEATLFFFFLNVFYSLIMTITIFHCFER